MSVHGILVAAVCAAAAAAMAGPPWEGRLDAPEWPDVTPQFYDDANDPACSVRGPYFGGRFVSAGADAEARANGADPAPKYRLRRRFALKAAPADAWLQGVGDTMATFSLNGRVAMRSAYERSAASGVPASTNVPSLLQEGENVLDVEYVVNAKMEYGLPRPYPGGVLAELFVAYADGTTERIDTDESFESSVDGRAWTGVVCSDPPPAPPRCTRLAYRDFARPQRFLGGGPESPRVRAGETATLRYEFEGAPPEGDFTADLKLSRDGATWWDETIPLGSSNVVRLADGRWRLEIPFETPLYCHSGNYEIKLSSSGVCCDDGGWSGGRLLIAARAASEMPGFEHPVRAEVKPVSGVPTVHLDGEPFPLLWGGVQYMRRPDRLPRHSDMPLTAVTVYCNCVDWHPRLGAYDFSSFDRIAEKYRRANPDAYFVWDLSVYPPADFAQRHPEEMSADETGDIVPASRFSWSYASRLGLDEIKEMTERAIRRLEASPYANRIIGYRVNSGVTVEWLGWDSKPGHVRDFSDVNKKAFAAFAAERYPELTDPHIPDRAERQALDSPLDVLWDRKRHLNAIAYMDYDSWIIAKDALEACGHAKDVLRSLGRTKLVGTYYGYTFYLNASGFDQWRGHFALRTLLDENDGRIDFLMSPQSYGERRLGDTCGDMKPSATLNAAGILTVNEDDTRTHNRIWPNFYGFKQTLTPAQTAAVLLRDASVVMCRGGWPYFYALGTGVDCDSPECAKVGRDVLDAMRFCLARKVGRHAEVALVASEKSIVSTPSLNKRAFARTGRWTQDYAPDGTVKRAEERLAVYNGEIFGALHTKFARSGVPVDFLLAEDLGRHAGDYKLYVFLNQLTFDDATLAAVERIRARGATILWLYAPGWSKGNSLADMKALTGIEFERIEEPTVAGVRMERDGRWMGMPDAQVAQAFAPVAADEVLGAYANGKPGLTVSKVGGSQSYFSGAWQLDVPFIRSLAAKAGVHVYCESDDPIEANDALFTLHARTAGAKTVRLPRKTTVVDMVDRRVVARDTDVFSFEAALHSTHLFYYGDDAEEFLR